MTTLDTLVTRQKAAGAQRVYKVGAVPKDPGTAYIVLGMDTGTPVNRRTSGDAPNRLTRVTAQCFGTTEAAAFDMARYADLAFYDQILSDLPGAPFCTRELSTRLIRDPDAGGWLYILHTYRF